MFYKVIKDNRVIDVLTQLVFLKYQPKHDVMLICDESEAQAILSSDNQYIWHVDEYPSIPSKTKYDTVSLVEIDRYEYDQLKGLNFKTPEEIIDAYTLSLIEGGVL